MQSRYMDGQPAMAGDQIECQYLSESGEEIWERGRVIEVRESRAVVAWGNGTRTVHPVDELALVVRAA